MLKDIPPLLSADLLWVLESMGHGDQLVLVDRNFPATSIAKSTNFGQPICLEGTNCSQAAEAILSVLPLDSFVEAPLIHMQVVGEPERRLEVHEEVHAIAERMEGGTIIMDSLERHAFYADAKEAFAVVQTLEARPYGCFLLRKGVIFD